MCPETFTPPDATLVTVAAPARLHLGFLDPGATLGRRFGSLGLVVDGVETRLALRASAADRVGGAGDAADHARIAAHLSTLRAHFGIGQPLDVTVHRLIPAHTGLGSGTQLALAVGTAFARLFGISEEQAGTAKLGALLARGRRSGVGISGFDHGGLILDGGPSPDDVAHASRRGAQPALLARMRFPEAWRVVLVQDAACEGLHGEGERQAIAALPPFPQHLAAHLCHLVLMRILPAVAESDFAPFAQGVSELQATLGGYFARAQGGIYTSAAVGRAIEAIHAGQAAGVGQSSWGPTGFAILPSLAAAQAALDAARAAGAIAPALQVSIVSARNKGAALHQQAAGDSEHGVGPAAEVTGAAGKPRAARSSFF